MEQRNDLYDVSAELTAEFGAPGSAQRNEALMHAWEEYNASVLLDARKKAHMTQDEVARKIGASKGYISRVERGLTIPTVATLYKIVAAMGLRVVFLPQNNH
jgi:DNA-binding XRE family transcriptional regulator